MLVDVEEEWREVSQVVGETLLDVERTFMNLVDQQALGLFGKPCVDSYQAALERLESANRQLLRHLVLHGQHRTLVVDTAAIQQTPHRGQ